MLHTTRANDANVYFRAPYDSMNPGQARCLMRKIFPACLLLLLAACKDAEPVDLGMDDPRREVDVSRFQVAQGLAVSLFAAEPMLTNPTNIDIDARGRVWVCEAVNYRPDYNPHHARREAGDRILILEDTDGDGAADSRKVYYQGADINAALGIMVLGNQVIVSSSPHVLLFTDTDGDDLPDRKEVLFSGIGGLQDDHGVHAFVFGPDGRLYFNYGNAGSQLMDAAGEPVIDAAGNIVNNTGNPYREGMVFRMNQDGSGLEVLGHNFRNNYEVAIDAYGTLWQSDNDDDGNRAVRINYVMEYGNYGYRDEMTGDHWSAPRTGMHADIPLRHWHLNDPGVVPNLLQTGAGSPTGILVYEGRLLPEVFHGEIIHADAGPGIVRAYPAIEEGAGYRAETVDILASKDDQWFRPSDVAIAPDGSLFIADWYDATVGGNQAVDQERGRIFRIAPPGAPYTTPAMDPSNPDDAAEALQSPNMATRVQAFQVLKDMGEQAELALLTHVHAEDPRRRARALWLLGQIEGQGAYYVDTALQDEDPNLRIVGLRLARQIGVDVLELVETVTGDASPQVRREAAIALRGHPAPEAAGLWAALAMQHDGKDRWYLEALGIGAEGQWDRFFGAWRQMAGDNWNTPGGRDIVWRARAEAAQELLANLIRESETGAADADRYFRAFDFLASDTKYALFASLAEAADTGMAYRALMHLTNPSEPPSAQVTAVLDRVLDAPGVDRRAFLDLVERFAVTDRREALALLTFGDNEKGLAGRAAQLLLEMHGIAPFREALRKEEATTVLERLSGSGSPAVLDFLAELVVDTMRTMAVRRQAVSSLGWSGAGQGRMLALLEAQRFPEALKPNAAIALLNAWPVDIRMRAEELLGVPEDRNEEALPPIRSLAAARGNPLDGTAVFQANCAQCHDVDRGTTVFGPSLSEIGSKLSRSALLISILHPDAGISHGFEGVAITLKDGAQAVGYVESENSEELALRVAGGVTKRYRLTDIDARTPLEGSLMPAMQAAMTREELVDLVAYLHGLQGE